MGVTLQRNATQRECVKTPLAHTMSTEWGQRFIANATAHLSFLLLASVITAVGFGVSLAYSHL